MKKIFASTFVAVIALATFGGVIVYAFPNNDRPSWVDSDGRVDYSGLDDAELIPYTCWSGKTIKLSGKILKSKTMNHREDSFEFKLGMAKTSELRQIPGVVVHDAQGNETIIIDESNPLVHKIMQKYELKETPQCK